jgi:hypothetical protein
MKENKEKTKTERKEDMAKSKEEDRILHNLGKEFVVNFHLDMQCNNCHGKQ